MTFAEHVRRLLLLSFVLVMLAMDPLPTAGSSQFVPEALSKAKPFAQNEDDKGNMLRLTRFARSLSMTMAKERHPERAKRVEG